MWKIIVNYTIFLIFIRVTMNDLLENTIHQPNNIVSTYLFLGTDFTKQFLAYKQQVSLFL